MIEIGEYQNGKRKGSWMIKFRYKITVSFNQIEGEGGNYNDFEKKSGNWVEIYQTSKVNVNQPWLEITSMKGKLENVIFYHEKEKFHAGGVYDENGGLKNCKWIELIENYGETNQVFMRRDYLFCKKLGQRDILYKKYPKSDLQIMSNNQNCEKDGNWIELNYFFGDDKGEIYLSIQLIQDNKKMVSEQQKFKENTLI